MSYQLALISFKINQKDSKIYDFLNNKDRSSLRVYNDLTTFMNYITLQTYLGIEIEPTK